MSEGLQTIALLGYPIGHSVSPAMHNAAFAALGLDFEYVAIDVATYDLPAAIDRLRNGEWQGANVTIPHKQAVIELLDALTESAVTLGAVNTIFWRDGQLIGDNTDGHGFLNDLNSNGVHDVHYQDKPVLVFGTGGSARAVVNALAPRAAEIRMLGRNVRAGSQLAGEVNRALYARILNFDWTPIDLGEASQGCVLAVNCTPLGMTPDIHSTPWFPVVPFPTGIFIYDLVYNPPITKLVHQAHSHKLHSTGGLGMLVQQGTLAFERWTGQKPPLDVMREAAASDLQVRSEQRLEAP